ncbi:MAG: hypothetical protein QMC81_02900 [Thermoanaerobacterales bacterium]|nr:hypothetical protein [Thermoanaerobacterales bacterium]
MLLYLGLFLTLLATLIVLTVPFDDYEPSPAQLTADRVRQKLIEHYTRGTKEVTLKVLGRSVGQLIRFSMLFGGILGGLTFLASVRFIGLWALPLAVLVGLGGIGVVEFGLRNEFRSWQDRMVDGLPQLVGFVPAFLSVGSITPSEALRLTLPFLPQPLRSEMAAVVDKITDTGKVREALDELALRVRHPLFDAIAFRLAAAWDVKVTPDLFDDLDDQIAYRRAEMAARTTTTKAGLLGLICAGGLAGAGLVFLYPGVKFMFSQVGRGFGM